MIDINLLKKNIEEIANILAKKKFKLDINKFFNYEKQRKKLQIKLEKIQSQTKLLSKKIGIAKINNEKYEHLLKQANNTNKNVHDIKNKLNFIKKNIHNYLSLIPNFCFNLVDIPEGYNDNDDIEIYRWGNPKKYDFKVRSHLELGNLINNELDFSSASTISGSQFVVMKGNIAYMHRALTQFMLDIHVQQHGYEEFYLPYLVNKNSLYGTGQLPKFIDDIFYIQKKIKSKRKSLALIPTGEVPLVNLVRNKIFKENKLPLKMVSHTPCFRYEAGSYGKSAQGLIRMHQFDKIELVQVTTPEKSMQTLEEVTQHAEKILQLLKLPYRKILLCSGNTGFTSCKTYDLEVWLPSQSSYKEVSSCSNTGDFQSRRIKTKYKKPNIKKNIFLHILNGSGLAVNRTLAAILENYQLINGNVSIPNVIQPYMNYMTCI